MLPLLLIWLTLRPCNFVSIGRILTKPTPIDSRVLALSIGLGLVKIRPLLVKLRVVEVDHINNKVKYP